MRSFDIVDEKVLEADFFLEKLKEEKEFFIARFYFSAFVSSTRSITFALQSSISELKGFKEWYSDIQNDLSEDKVSRFFNKVRRESQHIGITPLNAGSASLDEKGNLVILYYFTDVTDARPAEYPETDALTSCSLYLKKLVEIVFDCYTTFGQAIDPYLYYSQENMTNLSKTIDDFDEEVFGQRGWTSGIPTEHRLELIRRAMPGCRIDHLFEKYLHKERSPQTS